MNTAAIENLLLAARMLGGDPTAPLPMIDPLTFCKLGQDYEDRMPQTKLRDTAALLLGCSSAAASTNGGSSRSSPSMLSAQSSQRSSAPNSPDAHGDRPSTSQSTRQSRAAHNELEKNRRANLRNYLDKLKSVLPADPESTRDTTLSLLTRSRNHIRCLKQRQEELEAAREEAAAENIRLQRRLDELSRLSAVTELPVAVSSAPSFVAAAAEFVAASPVAMSPISPPMAIAAPPPPPAPVAASALSNSALELQLFDQLLKSTSEAALIKPEPVLIQSPMSDSASLSALTALLPQLSQLSTLSPILSSFGSFGSPLRSLDLLNDGLLPPLPLLYPYTNWKAAADAASAC